MSNPERQTLAERAVQSLFAQDAAAQKLGIRILSASPGTASIEMTVVADMLNGHDICHGGFLFALADTAFAYACSSRNTRSVAIGAQIDFLRPAKRGDTIRAAAEERYAGKSLGLYDVTLKNEAGQAIALFRAKSFRIAGVVIEEPASEPQGDQP